MIRLNKIVQVTEYLNKWKWENKTEIELQRKIERIPTDFMEK